MDNQDVHLHRGRYDLAVIKRLAKVPDSDDLDQLVGSKLVALSNVPLDGRVPVVLFEHNVEHVIWKRLAALERRGWRRLLLELEWRKVRRFEARACARTDLTMAVSEADRDLLARTSPGARVVAIPTGVDTSYFVPDGRPESAAGLVFTGSMDWFPNEDGMLHFVSEILPLIRREVPGTAFTVVGRDPSPRLREAAAGARVHVTGRVDDVRSYVAEAAVYVVPLRV